MTTIPPVTFYPPQPAPGSNAIGKFEIGVSSVGTLPQFNWLLTVISQYANSPTLLSMLQSFNECIDQTANFDAFYDLIWNVATAQGYGLDVWGRIVGVVRTVQVASTKYLGFEEQTGVTVDPFNQSPLYSGNPATSNYELSDSSFRTLIMAKAFVNIMDGSILSYNKLLLSLFPGRGATYVTDEGNMQMTYTFNFVLSPVETAIVEQSGVLPRPNGVAATVVINNP